jgi:excisionase family DNA binding protein
MGSFGDLLTTGEAARVLGCSRQHVVDLCERGDLPAVSVGAHRRVRRADVEGLARGGLTRDQERSLWLHRVVAAHLAVDPDTTLAKAEENLRRLREVHPAGMAARWLSEWRRVLDAGVDKVFDALTSLAPWAVELRQNSPFAGVLDPQERQAALRAFQSHWRKAHAA